MSLPRRSQPSQVEKSTLLGQEVTQLKNINREALSHIWTHNNHKQVRSKREKDKLVAVEEEETKEVILSLGFLSLSDIVLSDESIQKKLLGFLPCGFLG